MAPRVNLISLENVSLVRKFAILFIVMSLLPFLVIAYLFVQYRSLGTIVIEENILFMILFLVGCGGLVGFYVMRSSIIKIKELLALVNSIVQPKNHSNIKIVELEESEILQLNQTFSAIVNRLEGSSHTLQYILSKLTIELSSLKEPNKFFDLIIDIAANGLGAKCGVLMLLDEEKQELSLKVGFGLKGDLKNISLSSVEGGQEWLAKYKKPMFIPHADSEFDKFKLKHLLVPPLLYNDKMSGVLFFANKSTEFNEDELPLLSNLASQIAVILEKQKSGTPLN